MTVRRSVLRLAAMAAAGALPACSSNETAPHDHTPATYTVLVNDTEMPPPYTFTAGQTVRVRLKFFNAGSDDLDDVESEHFGGLTFNPTTLATVARVDGHNFQLDLTPGSAGAGTIQVSYGHDALADETTFPPTAVTVQAVP